MLFFQCEVVDRTLEDGLFAMEILQPSNLQSTISYRYSVSIEKRCRTPAVENKLTSCSLIVREARPLFVSG